MNRPVTSVGILIPTHNRASILAQTLATVTRLQVPPGVVTELIVVANACTDETVDVCRQFAATSTVPLRCVTEPEPGLSIARNRAIAESQSEVLAFLDDDVWVPDNWLSALIRDFEESDADVMGGRVELWWQEISRPDWFDSRFDGYLSRLDLGSHWKPVTSPAAAIGANFAFRRTVFDRIGGFRKDLGRKGQVLLSGEETEFIRRALDAGFTMIYSADAWIKHWVARSRVNLNYLSQVAYGNGISAQLSRVDFDAWVVAKSFLTHGPRAATLYLAGLFAGWIGKPRQQVTCRLEAWKTYGRIIGTWQRLRHTNSVPQP
jgi:glycosyltransferase involved in cell wall biosynthesis